MCIRDSIGSELDTMANAHAFLEESKRKQLAFQKRVESILSSVPAVVKDPAGIMVRARPLTRHARVAGVCMHPL